MSSGRALKSARVSAARGRWMKRKSCSKIQMLIILYEKNSCGAAFLNLVGKPQFAPL